MPKPVTVKDVLYALKYGHETLTRTQAIPGKKSTWRLTSGAPVSESLVQLVCQHRGVTTIAADRDGTKVIGWGEAA